MTAGQKAFRRTHGAELFGSRELDDMIQRLAAAEPCFLDELEE